MNMAEDEYVMTEDMNQEKVLFVCHKLQFVQNLYHVSFMLLRVFRELLIR